MCDSVGSVPLPAAPVAGASDESAARRIEANISGQVTNLHAQTTPSSQKIGKSYIVLSNKNQTTL